MSLYDGRPDKRKEFIGMQKSEFDSVSATQRNFNSRLVEISTSRAEGNYAKAFDLSDKLLRDMDEKSIFYSEGDRAAVWTRIFDMLEKQYGEAIIQKYSQAYNEILKYGSQESYRVSHYPGTYEEYAKSAALDEVMSLYAKTRYGGYMHVIIMRVLEKHFKEEKEKKEFLATGKKAKPSPGLPQNITPKQKQSKLEQAKENVRKALLNSER